MVGTVVFWVIAVVIGIPVALGVISAVFELLDEYGWKAGQYILMVIVFAIILALAYFLRGQ